MMKRNKSKKTTLAIQRKICMAMNLPTKFKLKKLLRDRFPRILQFAQMPSDKKEVFIKEKTSKEKFFYFIYFALLFHLAELSFIYC